MRSRLSVLNTSLFNPVRAPVHSAALAAVALVVLTLSPWSAQGAEPWPTTRFKVFAGNPYIGPVANARGDTSSDGFDWLEEEFAACENPQVRSMWPNQ